MEQHLTSCPAVALIPAYKPLPLLPDLVADLAQNGLEVVVVNDGSGHEFEEIFLACSRHAHVCTHEVNRGKGEALKTGLAYIWDTYREDAIVVTVDADGQHAVKDAVAVCARARENPHTIVFGSRRFTGKVPFRSRIGNELTEFSYHIFSGIKMYDTQTGLRAFSGALIPSLLKIAGSRYEYEIRMLFDLTKQGVEIREHEIETIYQSGNTSSHFHPVRDTLRLHKQIFKAVAYSYVCMGADLLLFALLWWLTDSVCLANAAAKAAAAALRFPLNRRYGFKSRGGARSVVTYVLLSLGILVLNTAAVYGLVSICSLSPLPSKLLVTLAGAVVSWLVKKTVVRVRRGKGS